MPLTSLLNQNEGEENFYFDIKRGSQQIQIDKMTLLPNQISHNYQKYFETLYYNNEVNLNLTSLLENAISIHEQVI